MDATEQQGKSCIYPGCERPAVPAHPLGGPQPSFCDLEEHNALTAHQERQRLEQERIDEKSGQRGISGGLPASAPDRQDGAEPHHRGRRQRGPLRGACRGASSACRALDVKVVPADTDRFGEGHGFNTSPSAGHRGRDRRAPPARSATRRSSSPAPPSGRRRRASLGQRRVRGGRRRRRAADDRRPRAVRPRHRRAAARESRAGSTRRPSTATRRLRRVSTATSTSSATLSVPNSAEYGFIPHSLCFTIAVPVSRPSSPAASSNAIGRARPASSSSPSTPVAPPALDARRAELDRRADEHLLVDRLLDAGPVVVVQRLDAAGALAARAASASRR